MSNSTDNDGIISQNGHYCRANRNFRHQFRRDEKDSGGTFLSAPRLLDHSFARTAQATADATEMPFKVAVVDKISKKILFENGYGAGIKADGLLKLRQ